MQHAMESIKTGPALEIILLFANAYWAIHILILPKFVIHHVVMDFYMEMKFVMMQRKDLAYKIAQALKRDTIVLGEVIQHHLIVQIYVEMGLLSCCRNVMMAQKEGV